MPANLTPDYYAAEKRYRQASTHEEKIAMLREMLAVMPKHKGTEHLQGDLKRKIAKLQSQAKKKQATRRSSGWDHIPREGAGQVVFVGFPNSGKSSLLNSLTNAHSDIADYPFSTFKPVQGMMPYEDIQIQLVDLPPVSMDYNDPWIFNIIRLSDLVLLVVDMSLAHPEEQVFNACGILEQHKIFLKKEGENRPKGPLAIKSTLLMGTKMDSVGTAERMEIVRGIYANEYPCLFGSVRDGTFVNKIRNEIFNTIGVIRIYTKIPGNKADMVNPYILPVGTTVLEAAMVVHKDLAESMKYARLWGSNTYNGQRVEKNHILKDKDILEIHAK